MGCQFGGKAVLRALDRPSRHGCDFCGTVGREARGMPLNKRVLLELANLPHREGTVFRRPDGMPYERARSGGTPIKTAFKAACRRAGITDFTPHDCRHTWASWFYSETGDLRALMELGGWKSERMVMRYTHVNPDHLAAGIDRLPWEKSVKAEIGGSENMKDSAG